MHQIELNVERKKISHIIHKITIPPVHGRFKEHMKINSAIIVYVRFQLRV